MKVARLLVVLILSMSSLAQTGVQEMRISPEMELLAGVLSQTTWGQQRGPQGAGNEYYQALKEFFSPYQDHPAVRKAQEFTNRGFTYDAPPAFIAHLGPLPQLELAHEYSPYLLRRAGNRNRLEEFRIALRDLAQDSDFLTFYVQWSPYLDEIAFTTSEGFRTQVITEWLEEFFGWPADEFHLLLAPSMFPGGGYGASVTTSNGRLAAYQIIRENGRSTTKPEFPKGPALEHLTLHELGHSFVNPSLEAHPVRAYFLRPLFLQVRKEMRAQAYTTATTFLNEQVLRAMEVLAMEELYGEEMAALVLQGNLDQSFYLTEYVLGLLRVYQGNRETYPTFREFVPYLYDQLYAYQRQNLSWFARVRGIFPF